MNALLLVGLGGAAGSMLRYVVQRSLNTLHFPLGTLAVNIAGGFLIGLLWGYFTKGSLSESGRALLMSGFCGGFTTFSAFAAENVQLLKDGRLLYFSIYTAASVLLGILATYTGITLFK